MKVAAVIPALNEFERLSAVVQQVRGFVDEVLVVDDGSKTPLADHLPSIAGLHVVRHIINLGKGAALATGVAWAKAHTCDAVVFIDADGQHRPQEIPSLLRPIQDGEADIVFGVRKFHSAMPFVARMGNIFLTKAVQFLFGIVVSDTQSGYRALRMSAAEAVAWESPRYAVETEMIVNAGKHKVRYAEVPIETIYLDRYKGTTIIDGVRIFFSMIAWRFL
jgi:glycosyltransferase involved in cell wall biosynthesis